MAAESGEGVWGGVYLALRALDVPMAWWGIIKRGSPRGVWAVLLPPGDRKQETLSALCVCLLPFPFLQSLQFSFWENNWSLQLLHLWPDPPPSPPSPLGSSARKVVLASSLPPLLWQPLLLQASFAVWSNLPTFGQRMNILGILVYCAVSFPFTLDSPSCGCRISCKSEERQKERLKPPWCWRHAPHSNWLVDSGIVSVIIGSSVTMYWGYNFYWEFCHLYIAFDSLTPLHINLCDWPEYAH